MDGVACCQPGAHPAGSKAASAWPRTSDASIRLPSDRGSEFPAPSSRRAEEVYSARASLIFKHIQVVRFHDTARNALILNLLRPGDRGSPKNSVGVVIRDWRPAAAPSPRRDRRARPRRPASDAGRRQAGGPTPAGARWRSRRGGGGGRRRRSRLRRCVFQAVIETWIRSSTLFACAREVPIFEVGGKDTTDLEKYLYSVERRSPRLGFLGRRIDHHLAAMNRW
jgi:hypothetical protein